MLAFQVISIGIVVILTVAWQIYAFAHLVVVDNSNDRKNARAKVNRTSGPVITHLLIPFGACLIVTLGFFALGIIRLFDGNSSFDLSDFLLTMAKVIIFDIALFLKTWFAQLITGIIVIVAIYDFTEYGHFDAIPVLSALLDWLFDSTPSVIQYSYLAVILAYGIVTTELDRLGSLLSQN
jgi:hypothetical protein